MRPALLFCLAACGTAEAPDTGASYAHGIGSERVERACQILPRVPPRRACPECTWHLAAPLPPGETEGLGACLAVGDAWTAASPEKTVPTFAHTRSR